MDNLITNTTQLAMKIVSEYVKDGDIVIDATAGNGKDTLILAKMVGSLGKVYAFDIQVQAIENTRHLLEVHEKQNIVSLIPDCHSRMEEYVAEIGKISAVLFNLGYLPGGDKSITTLSETTLMAVQHALNIIKIGGVLCITLYRGHQEGKGEKNCILEFAQNLDKGQYHTAFISFPNQPTNAPEILYITKKY